MRYFYKITVLIFFLIGLTLGSCRETDDTILTKKPSNLLVSINIKGADELNPYGDGSGEIEISATAVYAIRYGFRFENAEIIESTSGRLSYTFSNQGNFDRSITIWAFSEDGNSIEETRTITLKKTETPLSRMVFFDEFNYEGRPDVSKWHHQTIAPLNGGWFNGEEQHYTNRSVNSYVSNGSLKIVAKKENYTTQGSTKFYTSARLNSKYEFKYGKVEFRAKLPQKSGTWPALWTLGANINEIGNYHGTRFGNVGWPLCGEIDILEQTGWDKNSTIAHFHWGDLTTGEYKNEGGSRPINNASTEYHTYSMIWDEEIITILVDGDIVHQLENDTNKPFNEPHYLLINIAMGGNLGGVIPNNFTEDILEIDWIRVYQ